MSRARELAMQTWGYIQVLGRDPIKSIEAAINRAVDEHGEIVTGMATTHAGRYRSMNRVAMALSHGPATAAEISRRLRIDRGNAHRTLRWLRERGMVTKDRMKYHLRKQPATQEMYDVDQ